MRYEVAAATGFILFFGAAMAVAVTGLMTSSPAVTVTGLAAVAASVAAGYLLRAADEDLERTAKKKGKPGAPANHITSLLLRKIKLLAAMAEVEALAKACDCPAARERLKELEAQEQELMRALYGLRMRLAEEELEETQNTP